eukprot:COSAG05_NODE_472_length_9495_cov_29.989783_4_plen_316_part_00
MQRAIRSAQTAGFNLDTQDPEGLNALHWTAIKYHAELAKLLLQAGATPNVTDHQHGRACLHFALIDSSLRGEGSEGRVRPEAAIPILETLLEFGADVNKRDCTDTDVLTHALTLGDASIISGLIMNGAATAEAQIKSISNASIRRAAEMAIEKRAAIVVEQKAAAEEAEKAQRERAAAGFDPAAAALGSSAGGVRSLRRSSRQGPGPPPDTAAAFADADRLHEMDTMNDYGPVGGFEDPMMNGSSWDDMGGNTMTMMDEDDDPDAGGGGPGSMDGMGMMMMMTGRGGGRRQGHGPRCVQIQRFARPEKRKAEAEV